jgi:hypothetical protein
MLKRVGRLFVIKSRWEAFAVIYALALGATERGSHYLASYPGVCGYLLFAACCCAVFMAGAKILDGVRPPPPQQANEPSPVVS